MDADGTAIQPTAWRSNPWKPASRLAWRDRCLGRGDRLCGPFARRFRLAHQFEAAISGFQTEAEATARTAHAGDNSFSIRQIIAVPRCRPRGLDLAVSECQEARLAKALAVNRGDEMQNLLRAGSRTAR